MNRAEHHVEADQAAAQIEHQMKRMDPDPDVLKEWSVRLQLAQVHATLAAAEVTPMPKPPPKPWPLCECAFLDHPHIWGSPCPPCGCARVKGRHRPGTGPCGAYSSDRLYQAGDLNRAIPSDGPGQ